MDLPADARAHAEAAYPNESCGLVYADATGATHYYRCINAALDPSRDFTILPEQQLEVRLLGELVAVVHSHPEEGARMSGSDEASHRRHGLTSVIFEVRAGKVVDQAIYAPDFINSDERPLLDRPFVHGVDDCYSLVRDYYARYHQLSLPDVPRDDGWWDRGLDLYVDNLEKQGFVIVPMAQAQPGDGLLLHIKSQRLNHAAIWLGNDMILHHLHGSLSRHDYYHHYYRQRTTLCVRHPAAGRPAWATWQEIR